MVGSSDGSFSANAPGTKRRADTMTKVRSVQAACLFAAGAWVAVPALAYEVGAVSDGGKIEGTVVFNGTPGTRKIVPTKDVEICGEPREEALIEVGPDKGVKDAVVYLVGVSKGKDWPAAGKKPELHNQKCRFEPAVQVIPAGPLDVVNKDPVLHNTHGYYGKRTAFNMAQPNQDQPIATDLPKAGAVKVDCDAHGWMEGWIYVVDNPYYSLTGADGKFSIADVPPGEYDLVALQSASKPVQQKVTVEAGKPTSLSIELKKK